MLVVLSSSRRLFPAAFLPCLRLFSSADNGGSGGGRAGLSGGSEGRGKTVKLAVSSLRIDALAAAGLDISRQKVWEAALDGMLVMNGETVRKKSVSVREGDVIEVDTLMREGGGADGEEVKSAMVKRGRVEVVEIGPRTRKGGYHVTVTRFKHFRFFSPTVVDL